MAVAGLRAQKFYRHPCFKLERKGIEAPKKRGCLAPPYAREGLLLLHLHALRQIAGFVHIAAKFVRDVVGENLERDYAQDRREVEGNRG
jgi:hypothetical protein